MLTKIQNKTRNFKYRLRAKYYSLFYNIGNNCLFQKIIFHKPLSGTMGKHSIKIGNDVIIFRNTDLVAFDYKPIQIGNKSVINQSCNVSPGVTIGENVYIGHKVSIISDTHEIGTSDKRAGATKYLPIVIADGCWIGANTTILGGVTIGHGTIIAAGSVVNKDCESNSLYAGVPARLIKELD